MLNFFKYSGCGSEKRHPLSNPMQRPKDIDSIERQFFKITIRSLDSPGSPLMRRSVKNENIASVILSEKKSPGNYVSNAKRVMTEYSDPILSFPLSVLHHGDSHPGYCRHCCLLYTSPSPRDQA
eukprot:TRINITY_DN25016_c0_g1_i1.p2 TRINITY_DN25016_c0_g1~~TRINITY_DN25016_c0_g1_i1.p2  ORF type:complete len:124 (+),score=3.85 TRINITY_DN25016_c0_g1_i1:1034-1405(+)